MVPNSRADVLPLILVPSNNDLLKIYLAFGTATTFGSLLISSKLLSHDCMKTKASNMQEYFFIDRFMTCYFKKLKFKHQIHAIRPRARQTYGLDTLCRAIG